MAKTTFKTKALENLQQEGRPAPRIESRTPRRIRIGLMGLGTVGQGLCRLLDESRPVLAGRHGVDFCIERVLVRDVERPRGARPGNSALVDRTEAFLAGEYDAAVECLGGIEPAGRLVAALLERGVPVVTANKALMAERGGDLLALAARQGTRLRYEASVAAGIPILGLIERALKSFKVEGVSAILNGTSNYILTRLVRNGDTLSDALREAWRLGYAEADPMLDLSGVDAAQKLAILSRTLGRPLDLADVEITGLEQANPADCARARRLGYVMKPVAAADFSGGRARGYVAPALVPKDHPLAGVWEADNGILLCGEPLGSLFLSGPGAGALPTAASILDDLLVLALEGNDSRPAAETSNATRAFHGNRGPGGGPERFLGRWFLSMTIRREGARVEDLLDFMAAAGAVFRELREFQDNGAVALSGITVRTTKECIARLASHLNAIRAVERFRAFRVVGAAGREERE